MPCEHGVQIVPLTIYKSFVRRFPPQTLLTGVIADAMKTLDKCVQCRECEKKCPYNLDIQALFDENAAHFRQLQTECGQA